MAEIQKKETRTESDVGQIDGPPREEASGS